MSEKIDQEAGELFATSEPEEKESNSNPDANQDTDNGEGDNLDLDIEEKNTKTAEEQKQKQIKTWLKRVESGEAKIDDIPEKWLQNEVKERYQPPVDYDKIVEEKLQAKEVEKNFEALKNELDKVKSKLSGEQKKEIEDTFKDLRKDGVIKDKALKLAMKAAGAIPKKEDPRRQAMRVPMPGNYGEINEDKLQALSDPDAYKKLSPKERIELLEKVRGK